MTPEYVAGFVDGLDTAADSLVHAALQLHVHNPSVAQFMQGIADQFRQSARSTEFLHQAPAGSA